MPSPQVRAAIAAMTAMLVALDTVIPRAQATGLHVWIPPEEVP